MINKTISLFERLRAVAAHIYHLPSNIESLQQKVSKQEEKATEQVSELSESINSARESFGDRFDRLQLLDSKIIEIRSQMKKVGGHKVEAKQPETTQLFADDDNIDAFYLAFENEFRGTEDEIQRRVKTYVPYFKSSDIDFSKYPITDIGSGRGELLKVLKDEEIRAVGVDINSAMVERASESGLEAVEADAYQYLRDLEPGSIGGVTGMHLVEHIPFNQLLALFDECYRAIRPGGLAIFETPNPENLIVGIFGFYMDPSHLNPIPPPLLKFTLEYVGFVDIEVLRLHPSDEATNIENYEADPLLKDLATRIYGAFDYAVVAKRPSLSLDQ